ncbi:MAG: hypothetical protein KBD62_36020 [Kofleriaceae bacterium]|nr:hypothetical protein [Kofleriaceae bacterium]
MKESQHTISSWAATTFGEPATLTGIAVRANEEMAELLTALQGTDREKALEECADVVIVLYRLATYLGGSLRMEIDRKMEINRAREWRLDGNGHGYHVKAVR